MKYRDRVRQVWAYCSEQASAGYSPSLVEIAKGIGLRGASYGYVKKIVDDLIELGYLSRGPKNSTRTLTVSIPFIRGIRTAGMSPVPAREREPGGSPAPIQNASVNA